MLSTIFAGSTLLGLASAASIDRRQVATASGFPIPANDSFYAPTNFASLAPGTIIASRQVQTSIQGLLQLANSTVTAQSYQVSYRTTGPAGEPLTAVTTVFVPTPRQANILLAYQSPEDSASINCAPSYWYRSGVNQTGLGQTTAGGDLFAITNILQQGWTVSAADYESNELAAFGIGAIAAHGVLDGIRAAIAFNSSGLSQSPNGTKVGLFGYSGGGQATGWAMQSAPSYAPELNIVGAALGGLPANLTADGIYLDGKAGSGFIPIVIASLAKYYTPLRTRLEAILTDAGRAAEALAVNSCTVTMLTRYANQFFINGTTYQTVGASILSDSQIQPYFEAQTVAVNASLVPKAPMYAVHCASDETVAIGPADVAYASWCRLGSAPITYLRDVSGTCSHVTEAGLAYPEFFAFLRGRFNGTAPATSCSVTNRSLSANGSVPALSSFYGSYLTNI